ncbi:MAG: chemotaxis protein CheW [Labilithrix sp.]|nr:chemotaxis protein CheW [Labilithrix sp.]MCW5815426.1 chemotaxis protein CheW [Labilithrix sp.]
MKTVAQIAAEFDRAFAEPAVLDRGRGAPALAIRAGGARYVVPLAALSVVGRSPKIVPLPGGGAAQLGLAGIRGSLVVVLSLPALLGRANGTHGWIATPAARRGLALAFDELEGQLLLEPGEEPAELLDLAALLARGGIAT